MRQKSVGEVLRTARENRGWNFVDLQRMTKIQAVYLQALEYNDFDSISNADDVRLILTRYAEILDLDAAILLEAYNTNSLVKYYEQGEEEKLALELKRSYKVRKRKKRSYLPLMYLLLMASLIVIFVTYVVYGRIQRNLSSVPETTDYTVVNQTISNTNTTEIPHSSAEQSTSTSSSGLAEENITISGSGSHITATVKNVHYPLEITLTAKDVTSWISLSDTSLSEGIVLSTTNPTITTTVEEGTRSSELVLGVVKGVDIVIGGHKLDISAITSDTATITLHFETGQ